MKKESIKNLIIENRPSIARVETLCSSSSRNHTHKGYHNHNGYQLVIVVRGSIEFMINSILHRVDSGHIVMIGSDLPHGAVTVSVDVKIILIHIPYISLLWCANIPELERSVQFIKNSQFGYLFSSSTLHKKAITVSKRLQKSDGFQRVSHLFKLFDMLSKDPTVEHLVTNPDQQPPQSQHRQQTSIERVFDYLYKHFQETLTLEDVAKHANQNPAALCRAFKKKSGYTIFQFANRLRIEQACQLLKGTDQTITQVAFQVGFNSFSHFSTQFQRIVQTSPTKYREKANTLN